MTTSSPSHATIDIDSGDNHAQLVSIESKANRSFDFTRFNSDVRNAIEKHKKDSKAQFPPFHDPDALQNNDYAILLNIIIKDFLGESPMTVDNCEAYLVDRDDLISALNSVYLNNNFDSILANCNMPRRVREHALNKGAREREALGRNTAVNNPYNMAISVIQSSGTGKSRMVHEAAKTVFTIPINVGQESQNDKPSYPPPDKNMRRFFEDRLRHNDEQQQVEYTVFLQVLFDKTRQMVKKFHRGLTGVDLAQGWARHLGVGQTDTEVGVFRKQLYDEVVETATKICDGGGLNLDKLTLSLQTSCAYFIGTINSASDNTNACFVYLDEAHLLTQPIESPNEQHQRNQFHNLGRVLSKLVHYRVFFIFLSTSSSLKGSVPPFSYHNSMRDIVGSQLVAPFTELPCDINVEKPIDAEYPPTLNSASTVEHMVRYGRPSWGSLQKTAQGKNIFHFAMSKLAAIEQEAGSMDSDIAAVGIRVALEFDGELSYPKQSKLVESHMRMAYSILPHGEVLHTGSPSEPILAEAAGLYLSSGDLGGIKIAGPKGIVEALEAKLLADDENAELVGRLILTAAHDDALMVMNGPPRSLPNKPYYHVPISVMTFLGALFHETHHWDISNAKGLTGRNGIPRLYEAFHNCYIFFSHFAQAADSQMLSPAGLATALVRGMALQANEGLIDVVIPIHIGELTDRISPESTSAINVQIKNWKRLDESPIDRSVTVPDLGKPVLSLIFELGITGKRKGLSVTSSHGTQSKAFADFDPNGKKPSDYPHPDDHHYQIVARGCSSRLFGPITADLEPQYQAILGVPTFLEDCARYDQPDNLEALWAMKPAFRGADQEAEWIKAPNTTT